MLAIFPGKGLSSYTLSMDSARFGRALGIGTRLAARTLVEAADAATSPNPKAQPPGSQAPSKARVVGTQAGQQTRQAGNTVKQTSSGIKRGSKRFGEAVWGPFVKLSGVLMLELTGVFFGIFAVFAITGAWKERAFLHLTAANHDAHLRFLMSCAMGALFGYFCISSFVKAHRRGRRS
jgi:hypothetical protein